MNGNEMNRKKRNENNLTRLIEIYTLEKGSMSVG